MGTMAISPPPVCSSPLALAARWIPCERSSTLTIAASRLVIFFVLVSP